MNADDHSKVWAKVADRLEVVGKDAKSKKADMAHRDLLMLSIFARAVALAYRDVAIEQFRPVFETAGNIR
jgi:hypothetical protein